MTRREVLTGTPCGDDGSDPWPIRNYSRKRRLFNPPSWVIVIKWLALFAIAMPIAGTVVSVLFVEPCEASPTPNQGVK